MKLHKESKGTLLVATIIVALFTFISTLFRNVFSFGNCSVVLFYGLVFWFSEFQKEILDHKENVIAPVTEKW